jgi:coenzyme PQQ synthesis protein D (PqqD)
MSVGDASAVNVHTILVRDCEPIGAPVGERVVVLSIRAGSYFTFNTVGAQIWALLEQPRRVGDICDVLAQSHGVTPDTVINDVGPFLNALLRRDLVRVVGPDEPT